MASNLVAVSMERVKNCMWVFIAIVKKGKREFVEEGRRVWGENWNKSRKITPDVNRPVKSRAIASNYCD